MSMIPCIKNKCIVYPACKSKIVIACSELNSYYNEIRQDYYRSLGKSKKGEVVDISFAPITDCFPKVLAIKENNDTGPYDYNFITRRIIRRRKEK